jgi:hypothetical protein
MIPPPLTTLAAYLTAEHEALSRALADLARVLDAHRTTQTAK